MTNPGSLTVTTPSDREIVPGWTMTTCELELRVGGRYRYEWRKDNGTEMGMGGVFREVVAPERMVATELFDQPWYPGEGLVAQVLTERGGTTTITMALEYESKEARDMVVKSGANSGMEMGYARLAELLAATQAAGRH